MAGNRPLEKRLIGLEQMSTKLEKNIEEIRDELKQMNGNNNPISLEMDTCQNTKMAMQENEDEE